MEEKTEKIDNVRYICFTPVVRARFSKIVFSLLISPCYGYCTIEKQGTKETYLTICRLSA